MNPMDGMGPLYDFKAISEHYYHESRRQRRQNDLAQLMMGVSSIGIGAVMSYNAISHMWADHKSKGRGRG